MREVKEKHNTMNEESSEYGLLVNEPPYFKKHQITKFRESIASFVFD